MMNLKSRVIIIALISILVSIKSSQSIQLNVHLRVISNNTDENDGSLIYYWPLRNHDDMTRQLSLQISLAADVESNKTLFALTIPANITIVCNQIQEVNSTDLIAIKFFKKVIEYFSSSITDVDVDFKILKSNNLPMTVECKIEVNEFQNQSLLYHNVHIDSFQYNNSIVPIRIKVLKYPTISFERHQAATSNFEIPLFKNPSFYVHFRDKIISFPVNLTCSLSPDNKDLSFDAKKPQGIMSLLVSTSSNSTKLKLYVSTKSQQVNLNVSYTLECTARSNSMSDGPMQQYKELFAHVTSQIRFNQYSTNLKMENFINGEAKDDSTSSSTLIAKGPSVNDLLDPFIEWCNCDLTVSKCDLSCCCDKDCSEDEKTRFKCQTRVRNILETTIEPWTCNDIYNKPKINEPDWFPIICIHSNTTVLLGKFYDPVKLDNLVNETSFRGIVKSALDRSFNTRSQYLNDPIVSPNQTLVKTFDKCSLDKDYGNSYGSCMKTTSAAGDNSKAVDFFRFPQAINAMSPCIYNKPLQFLKSNGRSFCRIDSLDATSQQKYLNFQTFLGIIFFKNQTFSLSINSADVEYYQCTGYLTNQLFNQQPTNQALACSQSSCTISANAKIFDNTDPSSSGICSENSWTFSNDRISKISASTDYYLTPDSKFCQKLSAAPTDPNLKLLGVKYLLFWSSANIPRILARILVTPNQPVLQMFESRWINEIEAFNNSINSMSDYDNYMSGSTRLANTKSGQQGYIYGKPIISGNLNANNLVDISINQRLANYKLLNNKLCGSHTLFERSLIKFGYNSSSSCLIRLTRQELSNVNQCTCLKRIIFNKLNDYFAPSTKISKNGHPDMTKYTESDWLNLEQFKDELIRNFTDEIKDITKDTCVSVPYKLSVTFVYAKVISLQNEPLYEITNSYLNYSFANWGFVCKTNKQNCDALATQDFPLQFQVNFINGLKNNYNWLEQCKKSRNPSEKCIQQVFFTWPNDYNDPNFFFLYMVQLGLLFGIFSLVVIFVTLFGFVCPC